MIRSTILTVFLFLLVLSVKASPLPDPLPEAVAQDDQSQVACPPAPDGYQPPPPEDNGNEKPEEKARKKQEQEEAQRQKKEELRMEKEKMRERQDAERAKKDEEKARKESSQQPPPPSQGNNNGQGGGGGGGGGEGGVRGNTEQPPPPPSQQPKEGGGNNNNNQGGSQGGNQGGGGGTERPPPKEQPKEQPPGKSPVPNTTPVGDKVYRGPATFYGGALEGGNCMMKGYQFPPGVYGAAIGGNNWNNSANCGACAEVRGNGKKIVVMFVDQCSECGDGLDCFPDAFKQLADPSVGKFTVEWNFVECPVQGPIKITDKEGTNEYYVAMQVQNGKEPTESLELSPDGGKTYKPTQRDSTNHFILNGGPVGAQSVDVKVTSKSGKVAVVQGVPVSGGGKEGQQNYDG